MRKFYAILIAVVMLVTLFQLGIPTTVLAVGTTYYVDSVNGNDNNNGTSTGSAWQTLSKVNNTSFSPGDSILFKGGCSWSGTLSVSSSGSSSYWITYGSYGTGRPAIDAGNNTNAIEIPGKEYIAIKDFNLSNYHPNGRNTYFRRAIYATSVSSGVHDGLLIDNCVIHDVDGVYDWEDTAYDTWRWGNAAVHIQYTGNSGLIDANNHFNDITVQNCNIYDCAVMGVVIDHSSYTQNMGRPYNTDVVLQNCTISNLACDASVLFYSDTPIQQNILCYDIGDLVGDNLTQSTVGVWACASGNSIVRNCEIARTQMKIYDAEASGADWGESGTFIFEYNYTHGNEGGFYNNCLDAVLGLGSTEFTKCIIRYNVSVNDYQEILSPNSVSRTYNFEVYNNVFYKSSDYLNAGYDNSSVKYWNNIFYYQSSPSWGSNCVYDYNCYYPVSGNTNDSHRVTTNPNFVSPGTVGDGMAYADNYKIQSGSSCIDAGKTVSGCGDIDFWGNSVPYNGVTDIGAHEYGGGAAPTPTPTTSATPTPTTTPEGETFQASTDFSSTQGQDNWYYQQWNGSSYSNMTYDSGNSCWKGSYEYCRVGNSWMHPSTNDAVRKWVAPYAGDISITAAANIAVVYGSGEGVNVKVLKNSTNVWPASGWQFISAGGSVGFPEQNISVAQGDALYFILNQNSTDYYDQTNWDPIITYEEEGGDPTPTPTVTPTPTTTPTPTATPTTTPGEEQKLSGTAFGTSPAYASGCEYDKASDSNTSTFFDYAYANGGYTGIDLGSGNEAAITKIRYYPRSGWESRMNGGKFQGSNTSTDSGYTDLHTITTNPTLEWHEVVITDATEYRYLRYMSPDGSYGNIAEMEFYTGGGVTPTPTPTPTSTPTPTPTASPGESFRASTDFSSTQGQDNWYYQQWNGSSYSNMTWDSGNSCWKGSYEWCRLGSNYMHPSTNDAVRKWVAPYAGDISITAAANIAVVYGNGEGVNVKVLKNSTNVWPASGWQFISAGGSVSFPEQNISVAQGDALYFIINQNSTDYYDQTNWDPIITYE